MLIAEKRNWVKPSFNKANNRVSMTFRNNYLLLLPRKPKLTQIYCTEKKMHFTFRDARQDTS